jgi:hypothetical protein
MVVHQHPRVNPPTVAFAHFVQAEQKAFPVLVILKNHPRHPHGPSSGKPLPDMDIESHEVCPNSTRIIISDKQIVEMRYLTPFIPDPIHIEKKADVCHGAIK